MKKLTWLAWWLVLVIGLTGCVVGKQEAGRVTAWTKRDAKLLLGVTPTRVTVHGVISSDRTDGRQLTLTFTKADRARVAALRGDARLRKTCKLQFTYLAKSLGKKRAGHLTSIGLALAERLDLTAGVDALAAQSVAGMWVRPDPRITNPDQLVQNFAITNAADFKKTIRYRDYLVHGTVAERQHFIANLRQPPHFDLVIYYRFKYTRDAAVTKFVKAIIRPRYLPAGTQIAVEEQSGTHATGYVWRNGELHSSGTARVFAGQ